MTKTKTQQLSSLIKSAKFDYVNSDIKDGLFPDPIVVSADYRAFHFDEYILSKDAIQKMALEGYRPANAWELVEYAKEGWNGKDWTVALGSVGEVGGGRYVPYLREVGSERDLRLGWWSDGWFARYRFLAVRNSAIGAYDPSDPALGTSDALDLAAAIKLIKSKGYRIYSEI